MELETASKIIASSLAVITAVTIFYRKTLKPAYIKRKIKIQQEELAMAQREESAKQMVIAIEQIAKLTTLVGQIKKQVMPNGGSSMVDSLRRIEKKFDEVDAKFDSIQEDNKLFYTMQGVAFWVADEQGYFTYISPTMCKMVGRSESELLENNWISCLIKADENRVSEEWYHSVEERRPFDEVYSFKHQPHDIQVNGIAFHKKNNKTGVYTGSMGTLTLIN